jgi:hypothetical protein
MSAARVNHPGHYNAGQIEVIDAIEEWALGFNLGNAVKYIARAEHKEDAVEDLQKAKWYVERELARRTHRTRIVMLARDGTCLCNCGDECPLGKVGSQARCTEAELLEHGLRTRKGGRHGGE